MEKLIPKPCPCCRESGEERTDPSRPRGVAGIRAGVLASTLVGVRCYGCGLKLGRWYPDETPDHLVGQGVEAMEQWLLNQAIEAWNLRAESAELYDALKVTLAALERDNWEADQPAIKTARAAIAQTANYRDDLLEACKKAIEVTGGSKHWNGGTNEFLKMMELAIAKVEGRTP